MTIREITDKILEYHPKFDEDYDGCDGFKSGNPDDECTGIVSALVPTVEVIRKTAKLGCIRRYMKKEYPRDRSTMLHLQIIQVIRFVSI